MEINCSLIISKQFESIHVQLTVNEVLSGEYRPLRTTCIHHFHTLMI